MNDETTVPTENVPGETSEPAPQENQTETSPVDDWTVIETTEPESTEETVSMTVQLIEEYGTGIIHTNLFGSFLVCGTLIGIFLWRGIHGIYAGN